MTAAGPTAKGAVTVLDLGVGNLGNVERALRHLGASVETTDDPRIVETSRCLVMPGVGAFQPARRGLRPELEAALRRSLEGGAWLLGICVGFQLLFESSDEGGEAAGLGLLPGRIRRLPESVPVPHIGWNSLQFAGPVGHPLLSGVEPGAAVYFVHSYAPLGVPSAVQLATTTHGAEFTAIAGRGRVFGAQFHPEKSGVVGLQLIENFLALAADRTTPAALRETAEASPDAARETVEVSPDAAGETAEVSQRVGPDGGGGEPAVAPSTVPFDLFPAIDLRQGQVVRLLRGADEERTVYSDDPAAVLQDFAAQGARWTHVVDLDGAFGEPPQRELLKRLAALPNRPRLEVGGGLRSRQAIEDTLTLGVDRVVVGSLVTRQPELFAQLAREWPGRLVPALDVDGDTVRIDGWREEAAGWREAAIRLRGLPCPAILVTDISRDGVLGGSNAELAARVAEVSGIPTLVSGGVGSLADLETAARQERVAGVVLGKALYEGRIQLSQALEVCRRARATSALTPRIIPCLDIRDGRVVKGVRFLDLEDMGDPAEAARRYDGQGADELVFLDVSATRENRDTRRDWVEAVAREVFVPLTVGGGVRSVQDARNLLLAGADKVAVNSAAVRRPELLQELADQFGSQCVVLSIDARRRTDPPTLSPAWEVCTHGGHQPTGLDALEWAERGVAAGAGEILLTSMDGDGTRAGYDLELLSAVSRRVSVPVIASGGAGSVEHMAAALAAGSSAVLAASIFHLGEFTVDQVKERLENLGFAMRRLVPSQAVGVGA